jgi:ankyrin repeat protein
MSIYTVNFKSIMKSVKYFICLVFLQTQSFSFAQIQKDKNEKLLMAAYEGKTDTVIHLIIDSANINATGEEGITALMYASEKGHLDIVKILLYNKADPNIVPYSGRTALISAATNNQPEIVYNLLLYGADINAQDEDGATALIYASSYNLPYMVEYLLQNGANSKLKTSDSTDALLCAIFYGNNDIANFLLKQKVSQNTTDSNGFTPLSVAIQNRDIGMIDTLLKNLAEPKLHLKSKQLINPVDYARIINQRNTIKTLRKQGIHGSFLPYYNKITLNYNVGAFSVEDYFMGAGIGILDSKYDTHFELGFNARIAKRRILEKQSDSVYYQYWEKRRFLYASFEKLFTFPSNNAYKKQGIFIRLKGLYSFGVFEGVNHKPDDKFAFVPGIGYTYLYRNFFMKAAYEYAETDTYKSSPHWLTFSIGVTIDFRKSLLLKKITWM